MSIPDAILRNDTALDEVLGPSILSDRALNLGPTYLSFPIDALLCGILLSQAAEYFVSGPDRYGWSRDNGIVKSLVVALCVFAITHTAWLWNWAWQLYVANYGQLHTYYTAVYLSTIFTLTSIPNAAIQAFFARKAWILWERNIFVALYCATSIAFVLANGLALTVLGSEVHSLVEIAQTNKWTIVTNMYLFGGILTDIGFTSLILYKLVKSRTGFSATDTMVRNLIGICINSQVPPTLFAIVVGIEMLANNHSISGSRFGLPFICCNTKLYAICLMYSLDSRNKMQKKFDSGRSSSGNKGGDAVGAKSTQRKTNIDMGGISVVVDREIHVDDIPLSEIVDTYPPRRNQSIHKADDDDGASDPHSSTRVLIKSARELNDN